VPARAQRRSKKTDSQIDDSTDALAEEVRTRVAADAFGTLTDRPVGIELLQRSRWFILHPF
jgi:hypothetical protein